MTNPVGYRAGLPEGLKFCGHTHGLVNDEVGPGGGGPDPTVNVPANVFFYERPGGLLAGSPPPYSDTLIYATPFGGGDPIPYTQIAMASEKSASYTSGLVAAACASGECPYVEIEVLMQLSVHPGYVHFTHLVVDTAVLHTFDVSMAGFGALTWQSDTYEIDNADYGVTNENIVPPNITLGGTTRYSITSTLLRPTALTWPGQDPDNLANRNIWLASEVGPITWATSLYSGEFEVDITWAVHGRRLRDDYPTACPIIGAPSEIHVGEPTMGHVRVDKTRAIARHRGNVLTQSQLEALAADHGAAEADIAAAIAMAESGGDPDVTGGPNDDGTYDHGLWQINDVHESEFDFNRIYDPDYNAEAMVELSDGGTNWTPWSTYNSGAYLAYM